MSPTFLPRSGSAEPSAGAFASFLTRDRILLLAALALLTAGAWGYMIREARAMTATGVCQCLGMKMSGPDLHPWTATELLALVVMWAEMMVAMMVPTVAPMVLTFAAVNQRRREQDRPFVPTTIFLLGYLVVWTGFSVAAGAAQWVLHGTALLSPTMVSTSPGLGGTLLLGAGIFQFTPLKHACLAQCRSPLTWLMTDWRDGRTGAFVMGLQHGLFCTGCCWILMALLFVTGVMNLVWIAALTAFVLLEKVAPRGPWFGRATGGLLGAWGLWLLSGVVRG